MLFSAWTDLVLNLFHPTSSLLPHPIVHPIHALEPATNPAALIDGAFQKFWTGNDINQDTSECQVLGTNFGGKAVTSKLFFLVGHLSVHCWKQDAGLDGPTLVSSGRVLFVFLFWN